MTCVVGLSSSRMLLTSLVLGSEMEQIINCFIHKKLAKVLTSHYHCPVTDPEEFQIDADLEIPVQNAVLWHAGRDEHELNHTKVCDESELVSAQSK